MAQPPVKVHPLDPSVSAWERQPAEKDHHWAAFLVYRDALEDRSLRKTCAATGKWLNQIARWNEGYRWRQRVLAYDRHLDEERVRAARKRIHEMADRHAGLALAGLAAMQAPVAEFVKRLNAKTLDLTKIPDAELLRLLRSSASAIKDLVEVERVARGAPATTAVVLSPAGASKAQTVAEAVEELFLASASAAKESGHGEAPTI